MAKKTPQIIIRADLVEPEFIPARLVSAYDRFGNQILPRMGVQMYIESFMKGWILFFSSFSDFRAFFTQPLVKTPQKEDYLITNGNVGQDPLIWDYSFECIPGHPPLERLVKVLSKFYTHSGALGKGSFQEINSPSKKTRYHITRPSLSSFLRNAEAVSKAANDVLLFIQKQSST